MKELTWAEFFTGMTQRPLETLKLFSEVVATHFIANWWIIVLLVIGFWVSRWIAFSFIDLIIPRSLSDKLPRWAKGKFMNAWRQKLYRDALQTRNLQRVRAVIGLTKSIIDPIMLFIAGLTIFSQLGIKMTVTTGSILLGGLSLALGLGLQGVVKDIIGGITVLATDSYAVGDYIDAQFGAAGIVKHIGLRLTTLEGTDGTIWVVRHSDIPKIGNLTAAQAMVVTDITLTWREDSKQVNMDDLHFAEATLDYTLKDLAIALEKVDSVARNQTDSPDDTLEIEKIVAVLPDLIPTITDETLTNMKAVKLEDFDQSNSLKSAVNRITGRVPIFTKVETLGLVNSSTDSLTLRLRISLPPKSSRSQAMAVLRRAIFEAFTAYSISPSFSDVPENELPAVTLFEAGGHAV